MKQKLLFPLIRSRLKEMLNGYVQHPFLAVDNEDYIVPPGLGDQVGICGRWY